MSEQERTRRVAETIMTQSTWNGETFRAGEFVAILDGRIVAVAEDASAAISALRAIDADPKRGMVVEAGRTPVDVIR